MWSGGLDSTIIFLDWIVSQKQFDTLYVNLDNNHLKAEAEIRTQTKIQSYLKKVYGKKSINQVKNHTVDVPIIRPHRHSIISLHQPHLWLFGILNFLNNQDCYDNIAFGYTVDDYTGEIKSIKQNLVMSYTSLCKLMFHKTWSDGSKIELPELIFPLISYTKKQLYTRALSINTKLIRMTWTCESPIKKKNNHIVQCGKCHTCQSRTDKLK